MATAPNTNCSICLNAFDHSQTLVSTKCLHTFHQTCLLKVIENNPFCPVCGNSANLTTITQFRLSSIVSSNQGAIPKKKKISTVVTRSSSKLAEVDNNRNLSFNFAELAQNPVQDSNSTIINNPSTPQAPVDNVNWETEIQKIYKTIDSLTQKLDQMNIARNLEPSFPHEIFPPINSSPQNMNCNRGQPNNNDPNISHLNYNESGQFRNSISSLALTNSSKVANLINSWNVKFDGSSSNFPIGKFLYVITALTTDNLGGDFQLLCDHFQILLIGRAKEWYWRYRGSVKQVTWQNLCIALKSYFADHLSDNDIREMIRERKQLIGESFDEYYAAILKLCDRLRYPLLEPDLVEILKRNLKPQLRRELFYINISSVAHLRHLLLRREILNGEMEKYNTRPPQKRVSEVEYNEEDMDRLEDISAIDSQNKLICWNCRQPGHVFADCREDRTIFCYGCGAEKIFKPDCLHCQNQGNARAGGFRPRR